MISGPYQIRVGRLMDGWYVQEFADRYTEFGPFRWWWVARIVMAFVRMA